MPEVLVRELERIKEAQAARRRILGKACAPHDLVFCQPNGRPLHAHNVTMRDFRRVIKNAGVPRIRFHELRHCCATLLLRYGVHAPVTQEILGHANIGTTMNTCSHVLAPPWRRRQSPSWIACSTLAFAGICKTKRPEKRERAQTLVILGGPGGN